MSVVEMASKQKESAMLKVADPKLRERIAAAQTWLGEKYSLKKTWAKVAAEIPGYDDSSISSFAKGNYPGNPERILAAIERAREVADDRAANVFRPAFVETSIAKKIRRAVRQTRSRGELGIVAAHSGLGKTMAIDEINAGDPSLLLFRANPTLSFRPWPLISVLLGAIGHGDSKRPSPAHAYETLKSAFRSSRKMLLVDEAQFVSREGLDLLRCLSEDAGIPILFSGNETLYECGFLAGAKPAAFVQFSTRCSVEEYYTLDQITRNDVALIAAQLLSEETLEETVEVLHTAARQSGGFRRLKTLLQRSLEKAKGRSIEPAHVLSALGETARSRGEA